MLSPERKVADIHRDGTIPTREKSHGKKSKKAIVGRNTDKIHRNSLSVMSAVRYRGMSEEHWKKRQINQEGTPFTPQTGAPLGKCDRKL